MNFPTGANALLIALQTPSPKGTLGIPVLLWGKPGVGKSSFLEGLETDAFPVITLIASIHDPTDFSGLPIEHNGKVRYAIPEWVENFGEDGNGLLFLDELTTAPPAVQAALLRVVLERKVGFHSLPNKVRIVAAANPPDLMSGGWELSPPLRNRFVHLQWNLPPSVYIQALEQGFNKAEMPIIDPAEHAKVLSHWKLLVAAFLKRSPNLLYTDPDSDPYAFASPRTWDFTASLLASCDLVGIAPKRGQQGSIACLELIKGAIGEGVAIPFLEFLNSLRLPDPVALLDQQIEDAISDLNDSELYVLFSSLNRVLNERMEQADFYKSALVYFGLVQQVIQAGRRDLIFVSLKEMVQAPNTGKGNLLINAQKTAAQASKEDQAAVTKSIQALFAEEGLVEFIDVFIPK